MKKSPKKNKSLAIRKEPTLQELVNMFAGSSSLVQNDKQNERSMILSVAQAFSIPATCINIMGGLPYINKDGLLFKLEEYEGKEILSLETKMVQYAMKPGDRAIAEAILVLKGGRRFNSVGEADEHSIKLAAVKMTPNMMAETRAQNRVIRKAIAARMLRDLFTKLGGKNQKSAYSDQDKEIITGAVISSAEEMTLKKPESPKEGKINRTDLLHLSLEKIRNEKDNTKLEEYRDAIILSNLYKDSEKETLNSAITEQQKRNGKGN